ncbi:MAG: hypothetical protein IJX17_03670 [Clostridia bacterium]|nr:hypothetical protein [Clostridia bacterium]
MDNKKTINPLIIFFAFLFLVSVIIEIIDKIDFKIKPNYNLEETIAITKNNYENKLNEKGYEYTEVFIDVENSSNSKNCYIAICLPTTSTHEDCLDILKCMSIVDSNLYEYFEIVSHEYVFFQNNVYFILLDYSLNLTKLDCTEKEFRNGEKGRTYLEIDWDFDYTSPNLYEYQDKLPKEGMNINCIEYTKLGNPTMSKEIYHYDQFKALDGYYTAYYWYDYTNYLDTINPYYEIYIAITSGGYVKKVIHETVYLRKNNNNDDKCSCQKSNGYYDAEDFYYDYYDDYFYYEEAEEYFNY